MPHEMQDSTFFERLFIPDILRGLKELHEEIQNLSKLIGETNRSLKDLVGVIAAIPTVEQIQAGTPIGKLPLPIPSFTLPLPPKVLNEMINAAGIPGVSRMGVWNLTVTVPAGQQIQVVQPVLPGTVHVFMAPLRITASYYSTNIVADVLIDGKDVTPSPEYSIVAEDGIDLGQYYYMLQGMTGIITNNTAIDTKITFKVEALALTREFFDDFYQPLIGYGYGIMRALAQLLNGGRSLP